MSAGAAQADAISDAIALAEAELRRDAEAEGVILDHADLRRASMVLPEMLGTALTSIAGALADGDPLRLTGRMRQALVRYGTGR